MQPSTLLVAMVGLVAGINISDSIPACAVKCLENGVTTGTSCSLTDNDCICEVQNYRDIYSVAQACVLQACGAAKSLEEVLPSAAAFCSDVTGGATAPPVDESPSATEAAGSGVTSAPSSGEASSASGSASGDNAPVTTSQPAGAASMGSMGGLGMLALGVIAAI